MEAPQRAPDVSLPTDTKVYDEVVSTVRQGKSSHGHSDSMVTVRLSTANEAADHEVSPPSTPTASKHASMSSRPDSGSDREDNTRPTSLSESIECVESNRTSASELSEGCGDAMDDMLPSPASDDTPVREDKELSRQSTNRESTRSRSISLASSTSDNSKDVDWEKLDRNEKEEAHTECTDESTALLLARLEQENNALVTNPKAGMSTVRGRKESRPPSMQQLKKLVSDSNKAAIRYSNLPDPPPMTELEFWSALVRDYPSTAQRLPTLTANKIRQGVPPPLRGVVWQSIAGARDAALEEAYDKLCCESSPYENLIHKDIGRSFPGVDMFRDPDGDGQRMLGKVLNAYSLYDQDVGYCQGLGFVVGPLLMQMGDKEAFCTLVRLMDHYGLRSCFLPKLTGLHLRVYQFQHFLTQYLPNLAAHLEKMNVEPLYITQWFLSFFGVTCPIPMLIRLYDVILTEGASETLMRVALSVMRRNEKKLLASTEFEEIMQLLLSRVLWDPYNYNADALMADFCHWTGLVTRDSLLELEVAFQESKTPSASKPSINTAAQRFLGRLWNNPGALLSPKSPFLATPAQSLNASLTAPHTAPLPPPPTSAPLQRTSSKQSMASTLNSVDGSETSLLTVSTDATSASKHQSAEWALQKQPIISNPPPGHKSSNKDKDFHSQIEDLLTALNNMQRENSLLNEQLNREREERDEDRQLVQRVVDRLKKNDELEAIPEDSEGQDDEVAHPATPVLEKSISELEERFTPTARRASVMMHTKHQLREESAQWKSQYHEQVARSLELSNQLTERERELTTTKEDLREARSRVRDGHKEKQRLEKANSDLRTKKPSIDTSRAGLGSPEAVTPSPGLRELKLGRASTASANLQPVFSKRVSSLSTTTSPSEEDSQSSPGAEDDMVLVELANAKTAEALAKQELEEMRTKLESFRKLLAGGAKLPETPSPNTPLYRSYVPGHSHSHSTTKLAEIEKERAGASTLPTPVSAMGGFFSGWGKRNVSSSNNTG